MIPSNSSSSDTIYVYSATSGPYTLQDNKHQKLISSLDHGLVSNEGDTGGRFKSGHCRGIKASNRDRWFLRRVKPSLKEKINKTSWMMYYFGVIYSYSKTKNNIFLNTQGASYDVYCFSKYWHQAANGFLARVKYRAVSFVCCLTIFHPVYPILRPSDAIWWYKSGSTMAQVMACCLTAPGHYLNHCWLILSKV